ncbi:MAG: hypothetical protein ACD_51C00314G0008 [uncultured bacterium]|nr:MAG: hypothetical protein ACD_51C00314G0008 [uncultured bacterium]OGJ49746.1 MAG: hypothetical protein A2344_03615 [Candidatus Peregrinibacteria bacterium RIFOXYB12_FULL_41_12]
MRSDIVNNEKIQPKIYDQLQSIMHYDFNYIRSGLDFILKQSSLAHVRPKKILVPAFICPIVPEVIRRNGFEVEFVDADLDSFNMKIPASDLDGIGAVFVCHTFGAKCEVPSGVKTIEDCAHFLSKEREGDFALYSMYKQIRNVRGGYVECDEDLSKTYDHLLTDSVRVRDLPLLFMNSRFFDLPRSLKGLPSCSPAESEKWDVLKASHLTKKLFEKKKLPDSDIYKDMKNAFNNLGLGKFFAMQKMPEGSVPYNFSIRVIDDSISRDELLLRLRRRRVFADRMWYNADTGSCKNAEILAETIINLPINLNSLVELKNAIPR